MSGSAQGGSERFREGDSASQREAERSLIRSRVYKLLAIALADPGDGFFVALKDGFFNSALESELAALGYPSIDDDLAKLRTRLGTIDTKETRDVIVQEHTNIFDLPSSAALPYETDHIAGHAFMKGDLLADIMGFYKAFGLDLSETNKDRADSIVAELEFMHVLCLKEAAARTQYFGHINMVVDAEKKFLMEHLGRWVSRFARGVRDTKSSETYALLLEIVEKFVQGECTALGVAPLPVSSTLPQVDDPRKSLTREDGPGLCETACPEVAPDPGALS